MVTGTLPSVYGSYVTDEEARARFAAARVARLATADARGRPHIVPITFAVRDDTVVTIVDRKPKRSRDLKRLRNITDNSRVSVLVDHYEDNWDALWWVRADGTASVVEEESRIADALPALQGKYRQYRDDVPEGPLIVVAVDRWASWSSG